MKSDGVEEEEEDKSFIEYDVGEEKEGISRGMLVWFVFYFWVFE